MKWFKIVLATIVVAVGGELISIHADVNASTIKYQNVAADTQQTLTIGLKSRNAKQLNRFINSTVDPQSKNYRKYLTPQQFGARYGLSNQRVKVVAQFMKQHHLKVETYPGNILMTVTGKTKDIERAFKIKIKKTTNQKHNYQKAFGKVKLTNSLNKSISFVDQLGLKLHLTNDKTDPDQQTAAALSKIKDSNISDRSYRKFGRAYNTNSLYQNGNDGQGQTIAILGNSDFKMSDINTYLKQEGVTSGKRQIKKIYVSKHLSTDKGDQTEVTMDTEQASAVAPGANINVYLGNDYDADYFITSFATAIAKDNVDVISSSYGAFETDLKKGTPVDKGETKLLNLLLKQAAAQGITCFNAAGDSGAYAFADGSLSRATGLPASSPYITAVGGTTLPFKNISFSDIAGFTPAEDKTISLNQEAPWSATTTLTNLFGSQYVNDQYIKYLTSKAQTEQQKAAIVKNYESAANPKLKVTAANLNQLFYSGGGGFSTYFSRPDYQKHISGVGTYNAKEYINFKTGKLTATPKLVHGHASGRNVPDISGNADSLTGYDVYVNGKVDPSGDGTSVITPQMAGMAAVINSAQKQRTGFWNPQLYRFAKQANSPFTPLNSLDDNNLYYVGQPGKIYNQATGLGTVDFTKLNRAFTKAK